MSGNKNLLILGERQYGQTAKEIAEETGEFENIVTLDETPNNENYKNEIFKQNQNNIDNMDENRSNIEESMEKPSFLNNNSNDNVNKSQEILQQINSYLDNEKKNLN